MTPAPLDTELLLAAAEAGVDGTEVAAPAEAAAAAVVAEAVVIAAEADAAMAEQAIDVAAAEVVSAASRAAVAAERARDARAFAAALAADVVATSARQAVEMERRRADAAAEQVRLAASQAAQIILDSVVGSQWGNAAPAAARRLAAVVLSAAEDSARATARTADLTAATVARAAADVAGMVSTLDALFQGEVEAAAVEVADRAAATASRLAVVTEQRVEGTVRLARQAAAAVTDNGVGSLLWSAETTQPPLQTSPARARAFVAAHLLKHDLPDLVEAVQLVVSELATNAVQHAETRFTVTLEQSGDVVRVSVRDDSPAIPNQRSGGPGEETGRGVHIVQLLSSEWGMTVSGTGSKTIWASFPTT